MSASTKNERYQRQILLKELGEAGQEKLLQSKVLVIGAGGLGCPALQYLAAAGVGRIGIVDFDSVDITNIQRQVLYGVEDVGKSKTEVAAKKLKALNPEIQIQIYNCRIGTNNALEIIAGYDLVIDGTDNFSTRYLVNDACVLLNKPLVYGAVLRFEGQVGVFNLEEGDSGMKTNYRDLFPEPPDALSSLSCSEVGVLGVLPGIIGTMQATEAIKIITGIGKPLSNTVLTYNALSNTFYDFSVSPSQNGAKRLPQTRQDFLNFNYDWFCGVHPADEISIEDFITLKAKETINIIDVREMNESPLIDDFPFVKIPLGDFEMAASSISTENKIVVFCRSGKRSMKAVNTLKKRAPGCKAFSLKGGIEAWLQHKHKTEQAV